MARRPPKPQNQEPNPRVRSRSIKQQPSTSPQSSDGSVRKLRDLYRELLDTEDFPAVEEELQNASDRTACIILVSMVERILEHVLVWRIEMGISIEESRRETLFERDGALSSFHGNIHLGRALRLYGDEIADDLNVIRRVRNVFAHTAIPISFKSDEIIKETDKLHRLFYGQREFNPKILEHLSRERRDFASVCFNIMYELDDACDAVIEIIDDIRPILSSWLDRFSH